MDKNILQNNVYVGSLLVFETYLQTSVVYFFN